MLILRAMPLLLLIPVAAMAQPAPDRPFVVPQHDVDVLYAVPVPAGAGGDSATATLSQRMRFTADPERQRVDPPGNGTYMITDYGSRRMLVVQPAQRLATSLPMPAAVLTPPGVRASGAYRRLGTTNIAGVGCTDWSTQDSTGHESTICLTDDGVMLRAMQQGHVLVQALQVHYGLQDPTVFAVPPGYRQEAASAPP